MRFLRLDEAQKAALDALNESSEYMKASPVQAQDGFWYLSGDILTDCAECQTYAFCGEFLRMLEQVDEPEWQKDQL